MKEVLEWRHMEGEKRGFVHLHLHSHFSLLDGLMKIEDIIAGAKEMRMGAVALTDHGNMYGLIEFYEKTKKVGIQPILGVEAYVAPRSRHEKVHGVDNKYYHLTLLCENETGWKNLIQLTTRANLEGFYYKPRMDMELLSEYHEGLIALSGCYSGEVIRNLLLGKREEALEAAKRHQNIFGKDNYFIEVSHHPKCFPEDHERVRAGLLWISKEIGAPLVATQDVHYKKKEDAPYHEILLAVQMSNKLHSGNVEGEAQGPRKIAGKAGGMRMDDFSMRSEAMMRECFVDLPEAIENTGKIAERCKVTLELGKTILPKFPLPEGETAATYLRKIVEGRLPTRYGAEPNKIVLDRVEYELSVIERMGYPAYFLIVQDFIAWARSQGIIVGPGRGSAAGSIVAYITGITNVDPLKYDLLFERFLNPDRIQMPDIDTDIADKGRDRVVQYLRDKYGKDQVANIITFGTMAARAAVRDAGRALGVSYGFCDRVAKLIPFNEDLETAMDTVPELKELYEKEVDAKQIIDASRKLEGLTRHASVHACGIVIGDKPLSHYVPLQYAPQDESAIITQFEMHAIESLGLLKMDILGLKNLSIMEETVRLIKENGKGHVDINTLPLDDPETYEMLQRGETTGVFQFESSGMRRYMKELQPTRLDDLVALVAAYRPGPMDLIPSFIARKHGREETTYLHPGLEPIMRDTYGIGLYQEQMMRIARDLAGYTLAEADTLRKAIGKKIKALLEEQREKLTKGMIENGIPDHIAVQIWELFPPFARYGFNKSHAVCYAFIGYQTAYLRAHYPVEFMTALLNNDAGDIERVAFLVEECRKMRIKVLPPDINESEVEFAPYPEKLEIRFGLLAIKNVGENIVKLLIEERGRGGAYKTMRDILNRIEHRDLNKKSLEALVKCGVFDSLGVERNMANENLDEILRYSQLLREYKKKAAGSLFGMKDEFKGQLKLKEVAPASVKQKLEWEKELLGLYISDHPFNPYRGKLTARTLRDAMGVTNEKASFAVAGLMTSVKKILTKNNQSMMFVNLNDARDSLEMIVFPRTVEEYKNFEWAEGRIILASGRMSHRGGEPKFILEKIKSI